METIRQEAQRFANEIKARVYVWLDDDGGYILNTSPAYSDLPMPDFAITPDRVGQSEVMPCAA